MRTNKWVCAQFGAREYYAIPNILNRLGLLNILFTDIWTENKLLQKIIPKFSSRSVSGLSKRVSHNTISSIYNLRKGNSEKKFDAFVSKRLKKVIKPNDIFYTYSYGSINKIKEAKRLGSKIVYGQINPGPLEADIVIEQYNKYFPEEKPAVPTSAYWKLWGQEIALADLVIVNSRWSKTLLEQVGVLSSKIEVIPLVYEAEQINVPKVYPEVLFGSIKCKKRFSYSFRCI